MNDELKEFCAYIVKLGSEEAANWIIQKYPIDSQNYSDAFLLIPHRSWLKSDQKRLAMYYFKKMPFASARPYEVFASFMSMKSLLDCVRKSMPADTSRNDLLLYHIGPVLKRLAKNEVDRELESIFLKELDETF